MRTTKKCCFVYCVHRRIYRHAFPENMLNSTLLLQMSIYKPGTKTIQKVVSVFGILL